MSGSYEQPPERNWSHGERLASKRVAPIQTPTISASVRPKRELTTRQTIKAGALAGLVELLIMYPLDVVKTRNQLTVGRGSGGAGGFRALTGEYIFPPSASRSSRWKRWRREGESDATRRGATRREAAAV